jgi:hypothetical protein
VQQLPSTEKGISSMLASATKRWTLIPASDRVIERALRTVPSLLDVSFACTLYVPFWETIQIARRKMDQGRPALGPLIFKKNEF